MWGEHHAVGSAVDLSTELDYVALACVLPNGAAVGVLLLRRLGLVSTPCASQPIQGRLAKPWEGGRHYCSSIG